MPTQVQIKDKSESNKLIKVAPFKKEIIKTDPHKHNSYFEIVYLSHGRGAHFIDYNKYIGKNAEIDHLISLENDHPFSHQIDHPFLLQTDHPLAGR